MCTFINLASKSFSFFLGRFAEKDGIGVVAFNLALSIHLGWQDISDGGSEVWKDGSLPSV